MPQVGIPPAQLYRKLLKSGLKAVCFALPNRYSIRDRIRGGFEDSNFRPSIEAIENTVAFLDIAARRKGLEDRIVKNICFMQWSKSQDKRMHIRYNQTTKGDDKARNQNIKQEEKKLLASSLGHFNDTLIQLNRTANLCLR
ncbi:UPF0593 mitochondrial protein [Neolecta irregularis DAH-3]|uniref:UPF0593 mitochondrial protein n=1 Tax=Neolecta irregularis (strain DAH-3) TaxID=1198029 RepID=A0A1U7LN62_NEOID|nr:UPF0593 mitochondrial protein [Neolecta irregularis DAH-3]|eukprot:OLL24095.1 UPF0593 mitochondrial protein [Neolecta irregularis DAH-3]